MDMPITVTTPRDVLTESGVREILPRLTATRIEVSGLSGNRFFAGLVGGTMRQLDPANVYAGGENRPVVMMELKLPDVGLPTVELRTAFIRAATGVVAALTRADHKQGGHLGQRRQRALRRLGHRRHRLHGGRAGRRAHRPRLSHRPPLIRDPRRTAARGRSHREQPVPPRPDLGHGGGRAQL
jgi:hypothetical protein